LKLLATGAPVTDFTSPASDANASLRDGNALVASMAIFPARPVTWPKAAEMAGPRYRHHDDIDAAGVAAAAAKRGHLGAQWRCFRV
jgi:hypothetical protein